MFSFSFRKYQFSNLHVPFIIGRNENLNFPAIYLPNIRIYLLHNTCLHSQKKWNANFLYKFSEKYYSFVFALVIYLLSKFRYVIWLYNLLCNLLQWLYNVTTWNWIVSYFVATAFLYSFLMVLFYCTFALCFALPSYMCSYIHTHTHKYTHTRSYIKGIL